MTKKLLKGLSVLVALLIVFYISYQIYSAATPDYTTQPAAHFVVTDSISCVGLVVRDEQVIDTEVSGVANYLVGDGEKVALNAVVAEVYASETTAYNSLAIETLTNERDSLESAMESGSGANLSSLGGSLYGNLAELSGQIASGDYSEVGTSSDAVLIQMSHYGQEVGQEIDYSLKISQLDAKIAEYEQLDHSVIGYISAPVEGYFISGTDGYEGLVDLAGIQQTTPDELAELIAMDGQLLADADSAKIIAGYSWYFAALIGADSADRFYAGQRLEIDFNYAMVSGIPVTVESVQYYEQSDRALVLFECTYLNSMLAGLRVETAEISFRSYSGVKIPRSALRQLDGETGVYIKRGNVVVFRPIEIVYATDDYVVASYVTSQDEDDPQLMLYDEIIVSGKDLYVGKELG